MGLDARFEFLGAATWERWQFYGQHFGDPSPSSVAVLPFHSPSAHVSVLQFLPVPVNTCWFRFTKNRAKLRPSRWGQSGTPLWFWGVFPGERQCRTFSCGSRGFHHPLRAFQNVAPFMWHLVKALRWQGGPPGRWGTGWRRSPPHRGSRQVDSSYLITSGWHQPLPLMEGMSLSPKVGGHNVPATPGQLGLSPPKSG